MAKTEKRVIGIMDPNYYSFLASLEKLIRHLAPKVEYNGTVYELFTKRMKCRPYNTLGADTETCVIMNRGAHWNPHRNSFFSIVSRKVHVTYNMFSFKAIDKNAGYGQMYDLGLKIPPTWAIPQKDYSKMFEESKDSKSNLQPDLIFEDHELFDLEQIGSEVGYPAYLKPQSGGGWIGVTKVNDYKELKEAYDKSEDKPMNLQKAVDYKEFCRSVGIGPQIMPMHYNATAEFSHDRYMRSPDQAIEFNFITPEQTKEVRQLTKLINAYYGWDHNSCESLVTESGDIYIIDYINAYPDSSFVSLHFYFPEVVKSMARWLIFCAVVGRGDGYDFMKNWPAFYKVMEDSKKKGWSYHETLDKYEAIADEYFDTARFEEFCQNNLEGFDEKALEFFSSDEFEQIIEGEVSRHFKIAQERPAKIQHYQGIHNFWIHCERERLAPKKEPVAAAAGASKKKSKKEDK
ncbi:MAG: hypothetical protein AB2L14_04690 [Candidatus Xenobiia bacterium LiM19]